MKRTSVIALSGGCLFFAVLTVLIGFLRPTKLVFDIPNQFSGPFILVEDPAAEIPVGRHWGYVNIAIPSSRIVRIRSLDLLRRDWNSIVAKSPDGSAFEFEDFVPLLKPTVPGLRGFRFVREDIGGSNVNSYELCLGTQADDVGSNYHALRLASLTNQKTPNDPTPMK